MASQAVHFTNKESVVTTAEHHPPATHPEFNAGADVAITSHDLTSPVDLNTTAATPKGVSIPGVLIAIPFPPAVNVKENDKRPSFLLYAPPRAAYHKPPVDAEGKPGKEKLIKRIERGWQEEVAEGNAIHDGEMPDAGKWKKTKGALTRTAAKLIQWLPNSNIEALSRIPPKKKMHEALVFMPGHPETVSPMAHEQEKLEAQLNSVKKAALTKTVVSGVLLPVTELLDWFVPIFSFEVDAAYFTSQLQGLRKATALTGDDVHLDLHPTDKLGPLQARLLALCNARSPSHFPDLSVIGNPGVALTSTLTEGVALNGSTASMAGHSSTGHTSTAPPIGSTGGRVLAEAVIAIFTAAVPHEVAARHKLDDLDELAEDIERCLHKGADEYVKSL